MTTGSGGGRRYDDREVARILKRATEIRTETRTLARVGEEDGLTLRELEEIAAEAGIDVSHLRQAAVELDVGRTEGGWGERLTGAPYTLVQEVEVEVELDEDGFQAVLSEIQATLKEHGHPSLLGRTLTWKNEVQKGGGRSTMVTVASRTGRTTVRVEENLQQVAGGFHGGITMGAGFGIGMGVGLPLAISSASVLLGVAFPLGMMAVGYTVARSAFRSYVGRRTRVMSRLLARLDSAVRAAGMEPPGDALPPGD